MPSVSWSILRSKRWSPAINDPDDGRARHRPASPNARNGAGLRHIGNEKICDKTGELRLLFRTPNWEDFVHLACNWNRHYGSGSIQITRRMRSMLDNLIQPCQFIVILNYAITEVPRPCDRRTLHAPRGPLARIADPQGLGGSVVFKRQSIGLRKSANHMITDICEMNDSP